MSITLLSHIEFHIFYHTNYTNTHYPPARYELPWGPLPSATELRHPPLPPSAPTAGGDGAHGELRPPQPLGRPPRLLPRVHRPPAVHLGLALGHLHHALGGAPGAERRGRPAYVPVLQRCAAGQGSRSGGVGRRGGREGAKFSRNPGCIAAQPGPQSAFGRRCLAIDAAVHVPGQVPDSSQLCTTCLPRLKDHRLNPDLPPQVTRSPSAPTGRRRSLPLSSRTCSPGWGRA